MSFVSRAVISAAVSLSVLGLAAHSSASLAAEVEYTVIPQPVATALPIPVPAVITLPATAPTPAPNVTADVQEDDAVAYPTLAAAVAAQETADADDEQLRCLAGAIYYESKGEPLAGQLAVAAVILNRASSGRFGKTPCSVVTQRGQFSFVRGGRIPAIDANRPSYRTALAVAKVAMADAWDSVAEKALFFHARRVSPGWSKVKVASIGNHVFYR
ncbi:cell wall hydrolase [Sphingomonas sp. SUN019]|uniref:cell wall hydrolase n=1 Tax=Sphingomonas sp. SUN019 TaxID=2937788 RepID=UPI002164CD49|nr:cell wall hydrolase [Sphingomonas sp. SUN019]UVO51011.1 cell wall hydrolase [Sphingomonas sp. SUN019]